MADSTDPMKLRRQLADLEKSMRSGVLTVEGPDTGRLTYRTYAEMQSARSELLRDIRAAEATASGARRPRRTRRIVLIGTSGL